MSENSNPNFEALTPIDAPALEINKSGRKRVHHTEEEKKEANKVACRKTRKRKKNTLAVLHDVPIGLIWWLERLCCKGRRRR